MDKLFLIFIILITSCSHVEVPKEPKLVNDFIEKWKTDYEHTDRAYIDAYKSYLNSVYLLYQHYQLETKFETYLTSIKNIAQLMTHAEYSLPQRYTKEKRKRWANERSEDYKLFKEKILGELSDRLSQERWTKIENDVGTAVFNKLIRNKQRFIETSKTGLVNFPL